MTTTAEIAGALVGGRYRLVSLLATGGMGRVWRGRDEVLRRDVAVKVLKPEFSADPLFRARFRAEARHTAGLSHPGIARLYDFCEADASDGCVTYLVMELVPGEPLSAVLQRERRLGAADTLRVIGDTAEALAAAHAAGVVHRDVKPGNLIVTPEGPVKVTDFGISRATDSVTLTERGTVVGTAQYLSPEQVAGDLATPRSDLYCLGLVAYECLAGRRPFLHDSAVAVALAQVREQPPALPSDVPAPVRALVESLLEKEPDARPADAKTVVAHADALRSSLAGEVPPARRHLPRPERVLDDIAPSTRVLPLGFADAGEGPVDGLAALGFRAEDSVNDDPDDSGHRRRLVAVAAVVVTVLLAVALTVWLRHDGRPGPHGSATVSSLSGTAGGAASVAVTADGKVGHD